LGIITAPTRLLAPFVKSLGLRRLELPLTLTGYTLSQVWTPRAREDDGHRWLRTTIARIFAAPA
jgi:DNA-binding transcriptional LysR family regulator